MMLPSSDRIAAFSGHRSFKMSGGLLPFDGEETEVTLAEKLDLAIGELLAQGYDTFLCGMAEGFDLEAASAVIRTRKRIAAGRDMSTPPHSHTVLAPENGGASQSLPRLIAVIPYLRQSERFTLKTRALYDAVLAEADESAVLSDRYFAGCYHARNDFLVDYAGALLCYYNGSAGGTRYTVLRAMKAGLRIINLAGG